MTNTNTSWERMDAPLNSVKALQWGVYAIWACLRDGEHIFRVERCGTVPVSGDGGYLSIAAALKVKGFS
jgi:hypothetical protein